MKKLFIILFTLLLTTGSIQMLMGQTKVTLDPEVDIVSRYIWRGADFGNSPAIQPALELGYGDFTLGSWASYATNNANFQEVDLFVSYTYNEIFTFLITDYFLPDGSISNNNFFNFDYDKTGHVFEGALVFNGTQKIPLSLMIATNFAGADARTADNKMQYSTYFELGYSTSIGTTNLDVFMGGTPTKPDKDKGESGYYGPHEGIINIGITATKEIQITERYALPLNISLITNPQQQNIFVVAGISF